jgi:hypothetical protein
MRRIWARISRQSSSLIISFKMVEAVGKSRFAEKPLSINKLWFLLDDNARCKIVEKVISGTPCGQNIQ